VSTFSDSNKVERIGLRLLLPRLVENYTVYFHTDKARQREFGDLTAYPLDKGLVRPFTFEMKAEERHTGNLFIETWSNRSERNPGWLYTCRAEYLFYVFTDKGLVYRLAFGSFFHWLVGHETGSQHPRLDRYPELPQRKCVQLNDTWGRLVPVEHCLANGWCREFTLDAAKSITDAELFKAQQVGVYGSPDAANIYAAIQATQYSTEGER
jgi:hypothetical protein